MKHLDTSDMRQMLIMGWIIIGLLAVALFVPALIIWLVIS